MTNYNINNMFIFECKLFRLQRFVSKMNQASFFQMAPVQLPVMNIGRLMSAPPVQMTNACYQSCQQPVQAVQPMNACYQSYGCQKPVQAILDASHFNQSYARVRSASTSKASKRLYSNQVPVQAFPRANECNQCTQACVCAAPVRRARSVCHQPCAVQVQQVAAPPCYNACSQPGYYQTPPAFTQVYNQAMVVECPTVCPCPPPPPPKRRRRPPPPPPPPRPFNPPPWRPSGDNRYHRYPPPVRCVTTKPRCETIFVPKCKTTEITTTYTAPAMRIEKVCYK
jgi:hypothetical protein